MVVSEDDRDIYFVLGTGLTAQVMFAGSVEPGRTAFRMGNTGILHVTRVP
jgi:3'-phosphoadenosine 5'-phosphosulfate sulfotransferase